MKEKKPFLTLMAFRDFLRIPYSMHMSFEIFFPDRLISKFRLIKLNKSFSKHQSSLLTKVLHFSYFYLEIIFILQSNERLVS